MKKIIKGLSIVVGIIVLGVIALVMLVPTNDDTAASSDKEEPVKAVTENKVYNVGDTIDYKGLEVTIVDAGYTEPVQYGEPTKGKVLTVTLKAVNNTKEDVWFENINFKLYDENNSATDYYYSYDDTAVSTTLSPGKNVTGKVYFDVAEGTKYQLIYQPSVMTFNQPDDILINIEL